MKDKTKKATKQSRATERRKRKQRAIDLWNALVIREAAQAGFRRRPRRIPPIKIAPIRCRGGRA